MSPLFFLLLFLLQTFFGLHFMFGFFLPFPFVVFLSVKYSEARGPREIRMGIGRVLEALSVFH